MFIFLVENKKKESLRQKCEKSNRQMRCMTGDSNSNFPASVFEDSLENKGCQDNATLLFL